MTEQQVAALADDVVESADERARRLAREV